jgi:hypothetical protein
METLVLLSSLLCGGTKGLGSDSFAEREAAGRRLQDAGWVALPCLLDAERSPDPEVRHRARDLVEPYRPRWRAAGRYWKASLLLWVGGSEPLPEAVSWEVRHDPVLVHYVFDLCSTAGLIHNEAMDAESEEGRLGFVYLMRRRVRGLPDDFRGGT